MTVTAAPTWTDMLTGATQGAPDPPSAWSSTARTCAATLADHLPDRTPLADRPAVAGLHPLTETDSTTVWPLDLDPDPEDVVVLGVRTPQAVELRWYRPTALRLDDTRPAPGTGVWGSTQAVPVGEPLATVTAPPGADCRSALLAGAHALGVARRLSTAFVDKARTTNRGFARSTMIEDPSTLKALLRADSTLSAATALVLRHGARADARTAHRPVAAAAMTAAGVHALDTARSVATELLSLTGASTLYDGNPMQSAVLHLGALGQHGFFSRATRLRAARTCFPQHPPAQETS